ncbi:MAG TPA: hypothetical protein VNN79_11080, partial [Actinomycetota bacterium]|nr:hypothetical protein [Actinomycetota bacterium]
MVFERSGFRSFRRVLTGVLAVAATVVVPVPGADADDSVVVTGTGDASDRNLDDAVCDVSASAGLQCTLRAAIEEANDTPGADAIVFDIGGAAAVKTITPATPLPAITETLTIDGYSQEGASANTLATGDDAVLKVQLNGTNAGTDAVGLQVDADDSVIKGLVINRFSGTGVVIGGSNSRLVGSFVGTNPAGDLARPNEFGVLMSGPDVTVGGTGRAARNLISGN